MVSKCAVIIVPGIASISIVNIMVIVIVLVIVIIVYYVFPEKMFLEFGFKGINGW